MQHIPHLFDFWANPFVHLLLQKSSMGQQITLTFQNDLVEISGSERRTSKNDWIWNRLGRAGHAVKPVNRQQRRRRRGEDHQRRILCTGTNIAKLLFCPNLASFSSILPKFANFRKKMMLIWVLLQKSNLMNLIPYQHYLRFSQEGCFLDYFVF